MSDTSIQACQGTLPFSSFLRAFNDAPTEFDTTAWAFSEVLQRYPRIGFRCHDATRIVCRCPYLYSWTFFHQPESKVSLPSTRPFSPHSKWWLETCCLVLIYRKSSTAILQFGFVWLVPPFPLESLSIHCTTEKQMTFCSTRFNPMLVSSTSNLDYIAHNMQGLETYITACDSPAHY